MTGLIGAECTLTTLFAGETSAGFTWVTRVTGCDFWTFSA